MLRKSYYWLDVFQSYLNMWCSCLPCDLVLFINPGTWQSSSKDRTVHAWLNMHQTMPVLPADWVASAFGSNTIPAFNHFVWSLSTRWKICTEIEECGLDQYNFSCWFIRKNINNPGTVFQGNLTMQYDLVATAKQDVFSYCLIN